MTLLSELSRVPNDPFPHGGVQLKCQTPWWDALIELARQSFGHHLTPPAPADDADADTDGPPKRSSKPTAPGYLGILRADLSALVRGWVEGDEICEIAGLGTIPVPRARELLGESSLRLVLTNGTDVQNVTYLGRGVNAAQLFQPRHESSVREQSPHDRDLKTYQGWSLIEGTGRRPFVPPNHPQHPNNTPPDRPDDPELFPDTG